MATKTTQLTVIVIPGRAVGFVSRTPSDVMAESIRQKIIDGLITRLQTIMISNGYETDLGSNVVEWRTTEWQESELPGGDVQEGEETIEVSGTQHIFTMPMAIEVRVSGPSSIVNIRKIIADITQAIGLSKFSDFIETAKPISIGAPEFDKKDKLFGGITMNLEVIYRTKAFDPYNNV